MELSKPEEHLNDYDQAEEFDDDQVINDMYLTFRIAEEGYGIGISNVVEIVGNQEITQVPDMPEYIKGVINLRGLVLPVIDLRLRFNMSARDYDERTCIIVVSINDVKTGLIVDTVSEVLTIDREQITEPNTLSTNLDSSYISGLAKVENGLRILLDGEKLLDYNQQKKGDNNELES